MNECVEEPLSDGLHILRAALHLGVDVPDAHHLTDGANDAVTHQPVTCQHQHTATVRQAPFVTDTNTHRKTVAKSEMSRLRLNVCSLVHISC